VQLEVSASNLRLRQQQNWHSYCGRVHWSWNMALY